MLICASCAMLLCNAGGIDSASAQVRAYDTCVAEVERDPTAALRGAEEWRDAGGGLAARHCRALALAALGLFNDAAVETETLANEAPDTGARVDLLTQAGEFRLAAAHASDAHRLFDAALLIDPNAMPAVEGRARASAGLGDMQSAIDDLNRVLWVSPGNADALSLRAAARRQTGDSAGALGDANAAIAADPGSAVAYFERGAARAVSGDLDGARRDWIEAERLDPGGEVGSLATTNRARLP